MEKLKFFYKPGTKAWVDLVPFPDMRERVLACVRSGEYTQTAHGIYPQTSENLVQSELSNYRTKLKRVFFNG